MTHGGKTVLNLNDCRIETEQEVTELKKTVGNIDVLLTQYNYANWVGNKSDSQAIQIARAKTFYKNDNQIGILKPKFIIPFASFSWFSHEENNHHNDYNISLREFINHYPNENIITLYLDDVWRVGEQINCDKAITSWEAISTKEPKRKTISVPIERLQESFLKMQAVLMNKNDWNEIIKLRREILEPCTIYLTDLKKAIIFDIVDSSLVLTENHPDVLMSSESLDYLMQYEWGRGTLMINGRFETNYETFENFARQTLIYYANNIGKSFPSTISQEEIVNPRSMVFEIIEDRRDRNASSC